LPDRRSSPPIAVDQRTPPPSPRKRLIPPPADLQPHYPMPNRSDSPPPSLYYSQTLQKIDYRKPLTSHPEGINNSLSYSRRTISLRNQFYLHYVAHNGDGRSSPAGFAMNAINNISNGRDTCNALELNYKRVCITRIQNISEELKRLEGSCWSVKVKGRGADIPRVGLLHR
uniref:Uncharacterized protein n=1 Tax=Romanomermis culicivorax TaxID=13658 RepID=A0A915J1A2_ROMCU